MRRRLCTIAGSPLVRGRGAGALLHANEPLSFWGGISPETGNVIDVSHPLLGQCVTSRVLAIPNGRGSCTGSQVVLELLLRGTAPAAILLRESDEIISLGAIVAEELFGVAPLPVVSLGADGFERAASGGSHAYVCADGTVQLFTDDAGAQRALHEASVMDADTSAQQSSKAATAAETGIMNALELTDEDRAMLRGDRGVAAQVAFRVLLRTARLQGASQLVHVTQAHIDSCIHVGEGSLRFVERFVSWGGRVRVPTSLNAVSVDLERWRAHGVDEREGEPASAVGEAYLQLGCKPTFTCAPYLLSGTAPSLDEHIGWSESNAVVYANSCLGARTQKLPDYLDVCVALTGRAPLAGPHCDDGRRPTLLLELDPSGLDLAQSDDSFFGALGYLCGHEAGHSGVPLVTGLEGIAISNDELKAFAAAFGTSGSAALFHIAGHTPEASGARGEHMLARADDDILPSQRRRLDAHALQRVYASLDATGASELLTATTRTAEEQDGAVQLVALGNPHLSLDEFGRLAALTAGRSKHDGVQLVLTAGREVHGAARDAGYSASLEEFGAQLVSDTCWCMIREPLVPADAHTLITNSAKYAHYGPGLVGKSVRFASLERCVDAAVDGHVPVGMTPAWLRASVGVGYLNSSGATLDLKLVVFDKDGCLLDFNPTWLPGYRECAQRVAATVGEADLVPALLRVGGWIEEEDRPPCVAHDGLMLHATLDDLSQAWIDTQPLVAAHFGADGAAAITKLQEEVLAAATVRDATPLGSVVEPTLRALRSAGLRTAIVTNDQEALAHAQLDRLGWSDLFDTVIGADSGHGPKPGPGGVLAAIEAAGVAPSQAIMIGDAEGDMTAGRRADCAFTVAIRAEGEELTPGLASAAYQIPDIGGLPAALEAAGWRGRPDATGGDLPLSGS